MASSKGLIAGNLDILMLDGQIITARETRHVNLYHLEAWI